MSVANPAAPWVLYTFNQPLFSCVIPCGFACLIASCDPPNLHTRLHPYIWGPWMGLCDSHPTIPCSHPITHHPSYHVRCHSFFSWYNPTGGPSAHPSPATTIGCNGSWPPRCPWALCGAPRDYSMARCSPMLSLLCPSLLLHLEASSVAAFPPVSFRPSAKLSKVRSTGSGDPPACQRSVVSQYDLIYGHCTKG